MLLLFSDGDDTSSWLSGRKLIAAARQADVVIYPVTIPIEAAFPTRDQRFLPKRSVRVADPAQRLLEALADDTGGRVFFARDDNSLTRTFLSVLAEFRQRYVLMVRANWCSRQWLARPRRQVEGEVRTGISLQASCTVALGCIVSGCRFLMISAMSRFMTHLLPVAFVRN